MINNLDMEFIQAFNPLYAVPIVVVIICAFLVYAVGFKSPVQPPSFGGIGEEKKISKKRKTKENTKVKAVQNGKMNGTTVKNQPSTTTVKSQPSTTTVKSQPSNKKKDPVEKIMPPGKSVTEKPNVADKKAAKKPKAQIAKKNVTEKKREMSRDEINDDGWVQLISKKGRKNRKKEDAIANEIQTSKLAKSVEISKSDESSQVEDSPKKIPEKVDKKPAAEQKQISPKAKKDDFKKEDSNKEDSKKEDSKKEDSKKEDSKKGDSKKGDSKKEDSKKGDSKKGDSKTGDSKKGDSKKGASKKEKDMALKVDKIQDQLLVEDSKPNVNDLQKLPTKENTVKEGKPREESNSKSKKKKKKNMELVQEQNDTNEKISVAPQVQIIPEIPTSEIKNSTNIVVSSGRTEIISGNAEVDKSSEVKASNVAFDELAGLYPEVKKKKKVRRDH